MSRFCKQSVPLRDGGDDDLHLGERKEIADAESRPTTERDVSEAVALGNPLWQETVRIKAFRVLPEILVVMNGVLAPENDAVGLDGIAANLIISYSSAHDLPDWAA